MDHVERYLSGLIERWEPSEKRTCCNCTHARAGGAPELPRVRCAAGHGQGRFVALSRLIRTRPLGFRSTYDCPDFNLHEG